MGLFRADPIINQATSVAFSAPRSITAAAAQVRVGDKGEAEQFRKRRASSVALWQNEAWEYYDAIAEIKFAFNLVASVISRIRLYAAVVEDVSQTPVAVREAGNIDPDLAEAAERALARLNSAYGGQAGFLRDASLNLSVTGECFLVQVPERITEDGSVIPESWDIRSIDELHVDRDNNYRILPRRDLLSSNGVGQNNGASGIITLPPKTFVGRIWRAHPRFSEEPDSSMRGILDLCSELLLLNRTFRATARSRLNAGAMYIPDGLSTAAVPDDDFPYEDSGDPDGMTPEEAADMFEEQLMDAMVTPIKDEDSASAVVPLIIRGPAELADKIKIFKFERSFDEALIARGDRVLERILQGLDVPKDIVTGLANVKYSNAQQIDDNLYKTHIEPMILLIADALTQVYLRPYLKAIGKPEAEVDRITVWYDPSSVATRSDRAADADSGYEKTAISAATWRRTHGFSDQDAPDAKELVLRMLLDKGSTSSEFTEALLGAIAPDLITAVRAQSQATNPAPIPGDVASVLNGGPADTAMPDSNVTPNPADAASTDSNVDPTAPQPDTSTFPTGIPAAPQGETTDAPNGDPAAEVVIPDFPDVLPGEDAPPTDTALLDQQAEAEGLDTSVPATPYEPDTDTTSDNSGNVTESKRKKPAKAAAEGATDEATA